MPLTLRQAQHEGLQQLVRPLTLSLSKGELAEAQTAPRATKNGLSKPRSALP